MKTNKTQRLSLKARKYLNDFAKVFLQIMAFNLATGSRKDGAPSIINTIGVLLLRFLFEHRPEQQMKDTLTSSGTTKSSNLFQQLKSKFYGNRKPKV